MSTFRLSADYLPDVIVKQFTALDFRVYRYMARLLTRRKEELALEYADIQPAQITIASAVGATIPSVSRSLTKLNKLGILHIVYRRKADGSYYLNRYLVGSVIRTLMDLFKSMAKSNRNSHLRKPTTEVNKESLEDNYFKDFFKIWRNAGIKGLASAPLPAEAG